MQQFLNEFSWESVELPEKLGDYPGTEGWRDCGIPQHRAALIERSCRRVATPGHELAEGDIWRSSGPDGRAWLWEIRSSTGIATGAPLVGWSCATEVWNDIQKYFESLDDDEDTAWLESLMELYQDGGVGALIRALRAQQEAV